LDIFIKSEEKKTKKKQQQQQKQEGKEMKMKEILAIPTQKYQTMDRDYSTL